jgi:type I restriction enzyme M protein
MLDDVWMLAADGWTAVLAGKPNTDLIPPALIVARYYAAEQAAIEQLETERDAIGRELEELDEEHGGEDGLLAEARNDKGKLTKASVKARLADIKKDAEADEERRLLQRYAYLIDREAAAGKRVRDAQKALDARVIAHYTKLTEADIQTLVVDDKWLTALAASVQGELDRVSQALTGRVRQLAERYATPLPRLSEEVEALAARVDEHLRTMGFDWR